MITHTLHLNPTYSSLCMSYDKHTLMDIFSETERYFDTFRCHSLGWNSLMIQYKLISYWLLIIFPLIPETDSNTCSTLTVTLLLPPQARSSVAGKPPQHASAIIILSLLLWYWLWSGPACMCGTGGLSCLSAHLHQNDCLCCGLDLKVWLRCESCKYYCCTLLCRQLWRHCLYWKQ